MTKLKEGCYWFVIAALIFVCAFLSYTKYYEPSQEIAVYYNHNIEANKKVIDVIQNAQTYVYFAIYTFTRQDIADALLGAKHRGLDVRGITDWHQYGDVASQKKIINELKKAGIPVATQTHDAIMHMKVVVTDNGYASGSYNWTATATDSNDEVIEIGSNEPIRKQYFKIIKQVLETYPPS